MSLVSNKKMQPTVCNDYEKEFFLLLLSQIYVSSYIRFTSHRRSISLFKYSVTSLSVFFFFNTKKMFQIKPTVVKVFICIVAVLPLVVSSLIFFFN